MKDIQWYRKVSMNLAGPLTQHGSIITASVVLGALDSLATEMGHKLMRMSHSSIVRESEDFGAAICDAGAPIVRMLAQHAFAVGADPRLCARHPAATGGARRQRSGGRCLHPQRPHNGASHAPDIAFCVPIFHDGDLVGFSVTTAHHLDIGACQPGSVGVVKCADTYAEGLQLRALRVYQNGQRNDMLWQMIADNVRVPDLVMGDMNAQIAACHAGAGRFLDLIERFGKHGCSTPLKISSTIPKG
jgi:N-methylhydantoinase B